MAVGLEVVVVEDLEAAVVVGGALEEEQVVEDVDSEVCSFFLVFSICLLVLASE